MGWAARAGRSVESEWDLSVGLRLTGGTGYMSIDDGKETWRIFGECVHGMHERLLTGFLRKIRRRESRFSLRKTATTGIATVRITCVQEEKTLYSL